jgi:hypothetical protein
MKSVYKSRVLGVFKKKTTRKKGNKKHKMFSKYQETTPHLQKVNTEGKKRGGGDTPQEMQLKNNN